MRAALFSPVLFALAIAAACDTGAAEVNAPSLAETCGGLDRDLRPDLPPVDAQLASPWCATFAARALLEHHIHVSTPGDNYQKRLSVTDMNLHAEKRKGGKTDKPAFYRGSWVAQVLQGAQEASGLFLEEQWPFDQTIFQENTGTLERLRQYYEKRKSRSLAACTVNCSGDDKLFREMEEKYAGIRELVEASANQEAFLSRAENELPVEATEPRGKRSESVPPFDIRVAAAKDDSAVLEELFSVLRKKRPVATDMCLHKLTERAKLHLFPLPSRLRGQCGEHAMVVVGAKMSEGKCRILLRNSHGESWPTALPRPDGTAWVTVDDYLKTLARNKEGITRLTSISPREKTGVSRNSMIEPRRTFVGKYDYTANVRVDGEYHGLDSQGAQYDGWMKDDYYEGAGRLVSPDGSIQEGTFRQGQLIDGTLAGNWTKEAYFDGTIEGGNMKDGFFQGVWAGEISYTGTIENEKFHGEGKRTTASGGLREGTFQNGALWEGFYRDVWNREDGTTYEGTLRKGQRYDGVTKDRGGRVIERFRSGYLL